MKKYFVFIEQSGEGCDYTIGCGAVGKVYEADSVDDLREKVIADYDTEWEGEPHEKMQYTKLKHMHNLCAD